MSFSYAPRSIRNESLGLCVALIDHIANYHYKFKCVSIVQMFKLLYICTFIVDNQQVIINYIPDIYR